MNVQDEIVATVHGSCHISRRARINSVIRGANVGDTHTTLSERSDSLARQQPINVTATAVQHLWQCLLALLLLGRAHYLFNDYTSVIKYQHARTVQSHRVVYSCDTQTYVNTVLDLGSLSF